MTKPVRFLKPDWFFLNSRVEPENHVVLFQILQ